MSQFMGSLRHLTLLQTLFLLIEAFICRQRVRKLSEWFHTEDRDGDDVVITGELRLTERRRGEMNFKKEIVDD